MTSHPEQSADIEKVAQVLLDEGWTCEYHEPDARCEQCRDSHYRTARAIVAALAPRVVKRDRPPLSFEGYEESRQS
jgi:hypothetical protein